MAGATCEISVTLTLSEDEANWLKQLVQNPITENESAFSSNIRANLWNALDKATERNINHG